MNDTDNVVALFEDAPDTVPDILADAPPDSLGDTQPDSLGQLAARAQAQVALLEAEKTRLELESLEARAAVGKLTPPREILTDYDARVWLVWAEANDHQDGCLCSRCPIARRRVNGG